MNEQQQRLEEVAKETGWSIEDVKRGYALFSIWDDVQVVQKIDALVGTEFERFETDTEAGEQALKDGCNVYKADDDDEDLAGWYVERQD